MCILWAILAKLRTRSLHHQAQEVVLSATLTQSLLGGAGGAWKEPCASKNSLTSSSSLETPVVLQHDAANESDDDREGISTRDMFKSPEHALRLVRSFGQRAYPSTHMDQLGQLIKYVLFLFP